MTPLATLLILMGFGAACLGLIAFGMIAPRLRAYQKRQTPPVDAPVLHWADNRAGDRLASLVWSVRLPREQVTLRRLTGLIKVCTILAPLLMLGGVLVATWLPGPTSSAPDRGAPPPVTLTVPSPSADR